ncbi:hypothetical protein SLNSH_09390 [Alsobacter soli]|uniref:Lectin-like protein BA14k n=1 Tax=Alsobacter soli TaxID=2109933 RepID=A0A2T1HV51_9HYPH|nr:hypothetical protein [Alsobacter soli]PSC05399.1 hypothetical protein SLNSH_09390 [Alsobacter soli]
MTHRSKAVAILAATSLLTSLAAMSAPAQARDGVNGALFGGLAAGAIAGGIIANSVNSRPPVVYREVGPPPPPVVVYPECHTVREPLYDAYGEIAGHRNVRVCD